MESLVIAVYFHLVIANVRDMLEFDRGAVARSEVECGALRIIQ